MILQAIGGGKYPEILQQIRNDPGEDLEDFEQQIISAIEKRG
jgi:hypothetical protein